MNEDRRRLVFGLASLAPSACGSPAGPPPSPSCAEVAQGPGLSYCLTRALSITFPNARSLAPGEVMLRALDDDNAAILARDEQGYFAFSATCPHACCTVSLCAGDGCRGTEPTPNDCRPALKGTLPASGAAFLCPCHGSEFAADGSVLQGPARTGLPTVRVELGESDASVDLSTPVDRATRVT